jgi:hypothetical protein
MHRHSFPTLIALSIATVALGSGCSKKTETPPYTQAPPVQSAVRVTDVDLGISLGPDKRVTDQVEIVKPNETVYVSVVTEGTAPAATLKARWTYADGQVVDESTQTLAPNGRAVTEFHVSKPDGWPRGAYKVELFLNDAPAGSENFHVS